MSPNEKKRPGTKMPDWICDQQYGECITNGYPTGKWNPTPKPGAAVPETKVVPEDKPDWDAITEGKVRHGVVCAMIEAGKTSEEIYRDAPNYVRYIIGN